MRGMSLHRLLGLGVLSVVVTLATASVAQAVGSPRPPLTGVHAALESKSTDTTPGQFGPLPDAAERAVIRSQAATPSVDSHDRATINAAVQTNSADSTPGQFGPVPDAAERAVIRSQAATQGYTPRALEALGQRWEAYAAAQGTSGTGSQISDSNGRVDLPVATLTSTTGDDTGIAWMDVVYGMLLGFALVALGGIAAYAARSHGRVPQS